MLTDVFKRRWDGARQSHVGFLRRDEGELRRAAALAFPSEGDADAAQSEPARTSRRRVPPGPCKHLLQETDHRDEHRQWVSTVRDTRRPRQFGKRLHQGRFAFFKSDCGLFGLIMMLYAGHESPTESVDCSAHSSATTLDMPLILLYVQVVTRGQLITVTGWNGEISRGVSFAEKGHCGGSRSAGRTNSPLFQRFTRTAYLYNGCLPLYNVVLTSRVHSSMKYSQQSTVTAADSCNSGISVINHCLSWSKFVNTHLYHSSKWFIKHLTQICMYNPFVIEITLRHLIYSSQQRRNFTIHLCYRDANSAIRQRINMLVRDNPAPGHRNALSDAGPKPT